MNFKTYLQTHARKLDLHLFEYLFEGADSQPVLDKLATYQNADGGFGNALEPDLRTPDSSALATTIAFQYLTRLKDAPSDSPLVAKVIQYLINTYDRTRNGWVNIPPNANQHPSAPWWDYKSAKSSVEWGNPSAEIFGHLLKHAKFVQDVTLLDRLSEQALSRLNEITDPEPHEIKCYIRLYDNAGDKLQKQLYPLLAKHIIKATKADPKDWQGYVATPFTFIGSPDSPFASLFDKQVFIDNVEHVRKQIVEGNHWEPAWGWGQFKEEWAKAKQDWCGKLTVENLELLRAFGTRVDV